MTAASLASCLYLCMPTAQALECVSTLPTPLSTLHLPGLPLFFPALSFGGSARSCGFFWFGGKAPSTCLLSLAWLSQGITYLLCTTGLHHGLYPWS